MLPVKYNPGEVILSKGSEVNEIVFILEGEIKLSFDYQGHEIAKFFDKGYYFGDYNIFSEKISDFKYTAVTKVAAYMLPKHKFLDIIANFEEIRSKMISSSFLYYKETRTALVILKVNID